MALALSGTSEILETDDVEEDDRGEEDGAGGDDENADSIRSEPRLLSHKGRISFLLSREEDSMRAGIRGGDCGSDDATETVNDASSGLEYTYLGRVEADDASMISFR